MNFARNQAITLLSYGKSRSPLGVKNSDKATEDAHIAHRAYGLQLLPAGGLGTGTITFTNSANVAVLFIDFNQAFLSSTTVGASDLLTATVVDIRLPGASPDLIGDPETFALSFANITQDIDTAEATNTITQATAAFTSSATLVSVPEPGTLALLGLGLAGLGFGTSRRKKVAA